MGHEAIFVLIPKEKAENSFQARRLVILKIENAIKAFSDPPYPRIGGDFSGLLSDLCGNKPIIPYYNKEMRDSVRKITPDLAKQLKKAIKSSEFYERADVRASDIKKLPELKKYNDADLMDALRLELAPMGLVINLAWTRGEELVYKFTELIPYKITSDLRENGRDASFELGYEDDANIVNECLYREVIDKMKGKVIDIDDIGEKVMAMATGGKKNIIIGNKNITPENVIGNKWIILVDYVD